MVVPEGLVEFQEIGTVKTYILKTRYSQLFYVISASAETIQKFRLEIRTYKSGKLK
jgi:hypothetical protein